MTWEVGNGEIVATLEDLPRLWAPLSGGILPAKALEIREHDNLLAEVKLKVEPMDLEFDEQLGPQQVKQIVTRTIGMIIAKEGEDGTFYSVLWMPTSGVWSNLGANSLSIEFARYDARDFPTGINAVPLIAEMGKAIIQRRTAIPLGHLTGQRLHLSQLAMEFMKPIKSG